MTDPWPARLLERVRVLVAASPAIVVILLTMLNPSANYYVALLHLPSDLST
jgi:hypothetical protein